MTKNSATPSDSASAAPTLYYDGDCRFCLFWINYWKHLTGSRIAYQAKKDLAAVELEMPDGKKSAGALAVFQTLAIAGQGWWPWLYQKIPGFRQISEWAYRWIAGHRPFFYWLTRILWGKEIRPANYFLVRSLFLKILALVYLVAFVSFGSQAAGLIGSQGILPVTNFLAAAHQQLHNHAYWEIPGVFWISPSDTAITLVTILGVVFSILLLFGLLPRTSLIFLFIFYLSFVSAGQVFMEFQWDILLLEAGFLAILVSFTTSVAWLFRWLVFRLMFLSGFVKLASHDPTWRSFTALDYHFETQPLPTIFGWFAHQLPSWFHKLSIGGMFLVELAVPFLIFFPRRFRATAAALIAGLEVFIGLTGNYTFFNLLTIALCLFLLDDELLREIIPRRLVAAIKALPSRRMPIFGRSLIAVFALLIFLASLAQLGGVFFNALPQTNRFLADFLGPLHIVNAYGLFAVMTTVRNEIIIQGSADGQNWQDYGFPYKPGDVSRAPRWVQPFQPRLDWQMWFAALGNFRQSPWFINLIQRVVLGSEPVLKLFAVNPFPDAPPKFARALIYQYHFTDPAERQETGAWWKRKLVGLYFPEVSLAPARGK